MLNPWLQARLYEVPVRPLLIEVEPPGLADIVSALTGGGLSIRSVIPTFSMVALLPVPAKMIQVINSLPGVRVVHADTQVNILQLPAPPDKAAWWPTSESRKLLGAEDAFKAGWTGESVKLGVVDSGIDALHPQLTGSDWESVIYVPVREMFDEVGHGHHVASTAAGKLVFNDQAGAFLEGVSRGRIHSVKALGRGVGTGFTSEIVNAMAILLEAGAQVVNMSLGSKECQGGPDVCPECRAVKRLTDQGILVVVAAGNSGPDANTIGCPGSAPDAITVGAIDRDGKVASFSSRGGDRFPNKPDVAAPGVNILSGTSRGSSIDNGDPQAGFGYAAISGTSMATPHIAGLAALLKHRNPKMTTADFKAVVRAKGSEFNNDVGYGVPHWSWFAS